MQDWDRLAMLVVGAAVSIYAGLDGWKLWKRRKYLAAAGTGVLILAAIGLPAALAFFAT